MPSIVSGLNEARRITKAASRDSNGHKRRVHRNHRRWAKIQLRKDDSMLSDWPKTCRLTSWDLA
jgi:hypothetical protein